MDKIWEGKSFEVGGHWPLWRGWKNIMTMQNRQKSKGKKKLVYTKSTLPTCRFCITVYLHLNLFIVVFTGLYPCFSYWSTTLCTGTFWTYLHINTGAKNHKQLIHLIHYTSISFKVWPEFWLATVKVPKHNLIWKILLMCACVCNFKWIPRTVILLLANVKMVTDKQVDIMNTLSRVVNAIWSKNVVLLLGSDKKVSEQLPEKRLAVLFLSLFQSEIKTSPPVLQDRLRSTGVGFLGSLLNCSSLSLMSPSWPLFWIALIHPYLIQAWFWMS